MEITIGKIIQGIEVIKAQAEWDYPLDWQIVLDGATDTMRKYQKIQEIIADWKSDGGAFEMSEPYWLRLISEVIEDASSQSE